MEKNTQLTSEISEILMKINLMEICFDPFTKCLREYEWTKN